MAHVGSVLLLGVSFVAGCSSAAAPTTSEQVPPPSAAVDSTGSPETSAGVPSSSFEEEGDGLSDGEVQRLGLTVTEISGDGFVPEAQAVDAVRSEYAFEAMGGSADAFLYRVTDPKTDQNHDPIRERPLWIVRMNGLRQERYGPVPERGTPKPFIVLEKAYAFVDAETGKWLYTQWTE